MSGVESLRNNTVLSHKSAILYVHDFLFVPRENVFTTRNIQSPDFIVRLVVV